MYSIITFAYLYLQDRKYFTCSCEKPHLSLWLRCLLLLARTTELSAALRFFLSIPSTRYQISYGRLFVEEHQHSLSAPCGWRSCFDEGISFFFFLHSIMFQASCFIMKMYLFSHIRLLHFLPLCFTPVSNACLSHYCSPLLRKFGGCFLTPLCKCTFVRQCETSVVCTYI